MEPALLEWLLDRVVRMRLAGTLYAAWGISAYLRCLDHGMRKRLVAVTALVCLWMLVVIIKWKIYDPWLATMLWHCYYIPMIALPLLCFEFACCAARLNQRAWYAHLRIYLWVFAGVLMTFVLTNNLHHQVFLSDGLSAGEVGKYQYNWGYWLFVAWSLACYGTFFAVIIRSSRSKLRALAIPVVLVFVGGLIYAGSFVQQARWALNLNVSLTYSVLVVLALELCLDLGFIPSEQNFIKIFDTLPIDLKVLSRTGELFRATTCAAPLTSDVRERVQALGSAATSARGQSQPTEHQVDFSLLAHPGELFRVWQLSGSCALFTQDVSDLEAAQHALSARHEELMNTNRLLEHRRRVAEQLANLAEEQRLVDDVEEALATSLNEAQDLLACMPQGDAKGLSEVQHRQLERVRMLVAYSKRKGSLVLAETSDEELERERLILIVNELASDMRAIGIDCAALTNLSQPVPAQEMSTLFDCLYAFAFIAFECHNPAVIYNLSEGSAHNIELKAMLRADDVDDLSLLAPTDALRRLLNTRRVLYSLTGGPGYARLIARVHQEGAYEH